MRVLLAEDDPLSQFRLHELLATWDYEIVTAINGTEAWAALQADDVPPLVVLDWMMPGMNGLDICRKARQGLLKHYVYIILLTGKDSREDIVAGLEAGADDYVTKPFDAHELHARLNAGRRIVTLQSKLVAAHDELRVRATHDGLTGLWNRTAIMEILGMEQARSQRESKSGALVLLDLDHFKSINDTYGHMAGDTVLCKTAQRIRSVLRAYDAVGRFGGEEFLAMMPGCSVDDAVVLANRIRTAIAEPMEISEGHLVVTASLGVAFWGGTGDFELKRLLRAADSALYRAKDGGRNRVELATILELTQSLAMTRESARHTLLRESPLISMS